MENWYAELSMVPVRMFTCKVCSKRCYGDGDFCSSKCCYSVIFNNYNTEMTFQ